MLMNNFCCTVWITFCSFFGGFFFVFWSLCLMNQSTDQLDVPIINAEQLIRPSFL